MSHFLKGISDTLFQNLMGYDLSLLTKKGAWELLLLMKRTSDIPPFPMGLPATLLLLLPGKDSDMHLILKMPSKLPLQPKNAATHLQM
ncbi:hypothetical protein A6R68_11476, partial [Neotoma lepida]